MSKRICVVHSWNREIGGPCKVCPEKIAKKEYEEFLHPPKDEITQLRADLNTAIEALEFYGSKNNYGLRATPAGDLASPCEFDRGKKARTALAKLKGDK